MDSKEKDFLRNALRSQRRKERFNKALAREVSKRMNGKSGYKKYIDLMNKVRETADEKDISEEKAVKLLLKN